MNAKEERTITTKGLHVFSFCDVRSESAQKLAKRCDDVRFKRLDILYQRDEATLPLQLKLSFLNKVTGEAGKIGKKLPAEEFEQSEIIHSLKYLGAKYRKMLDALWQEYRSYVEELERRFKTRELIVENITTTVGRSALAQRLGGDTTYTAIVNYTALGTDNTAPVVGDATLGTETYRKALSSGTDLNNVAYLETFFTASEVSGTFEEYGMFIDGTGTVDTGQLFNRFTATNAKAVTETMNVQSIVTFNDA